MKPVFAYPQEMLVYIHLAIVSLITTRVKSETPNWRSGNKAAMVVAVAVLYVPGF